MYKKKTLKNLTPCYMLGNLYKIVYKTRMKNLFSELSVVFYFSKFTTYNIKLVRKCETRWFDGDAANMLCSGIKFIFMYSSLHFLSAVLKNVSIISCVLLFWSILQWKKWNELYEKIYKQYWNIYVWMYIIALKVDYKLKFFKTQFSFFVF